MTALAQLAVVLGAFAGASLVAKALGAGWGTAISFGQLAFVPALVYVLLRDRRPGSAARTARRPPGNAAGARGKRRVRGRSP